MSEYRDSDLHSLVNRSILRHEATRQNAEYLSHSVKPNGKVTLTAKVHSGAVRRFPSVSKIDSKLSVATRTRTYTKSDWFNLSTELTNAGPVPLWVNPDENLELAKWNVIEYIRQLHPICSGALPDVSFGAESTVIIDTKNCPALYSEEPIIAAYELGSNKHSSMYGLNRPSEGEEFRIRRYISASQEKPILPELESALYAYYLEGDLFDIATCDTVSERLHRESFTVNIRPIGEHLTDKRHPIITTIDVRRDPNGDAHATGTDAQGNSFSVFAPNAVMSVVVNYSGDSGRTYVSVLEPGTPNEHAHYLPEGLKAFSIEVIYRCTAGVSSVADPSRSPAWLIHTASSDPLNDAPVLKPTPEVPLEALDAMNNWIGHFVTEPGALTVESIRGGANNTMVTFVDNKGTVANDDDRIKVRRCERIEMQDLADWWAASYATASPQTLEAAVENFSWSYGIGVDPDDFEYEFEGERVYLKASNTNALMVGRVEINTQPNSEE